MKLTTYKEIDVHVSEHSGEFTAEVHGNRYESTSLSGLKAKIDEKTKIKYKRIEAVIYEDNGYKAVTLTSLDDRGNFRHKGGVIYNSVVGYPDAEVLSEIDRLSKLRDEAYRNLITYCKAAKDRVKRVAKEDMTP